MALTGTQLVIIGVLAVLIVLVGFALWLAGRSK